MNRYSLGFFAASLLLAGSVSAFAQGSSGHTSHAYESNDGIASGEAGARAGTTVYNSMNPNKPLPYSSGNVVPDTAYNMGRGQKFNDAFSHASDSNAGMSRSAK